MTAKDQVVIISGCRTPVGKFQGSLSDISATQLGAIVVRDAPDLSRELRRLLADPDLRLKLGDAGFEAVASRHGAVRETLDLVGRYLYPEGRA